MDLCRVISASFCALALSFTAAPAGAATPSADYVPGEVIVTFKPSVDLPGVKRALGRQALTLNRHYALLSEYRGRQTGLVRDQGRSTAELMAALKAYPEVESVEPNYIRHTLGGRRPNDALFQQLWGLQNTGQAVQTLAGGSGDDIRFVDAWALARPSTNPPVVAVIDTGVYYAHPDLAGNMWTNPGEAPNNGVDDDGDGYVDDYHGYNFADGNGDPSDSGEHGSHVSGTIAAIGNNQIGVVGVNYRAKIMALRVSDDGESLFDSAIIEAVQLCHHDEKSGCQCRGHQCFLWRIPVQFRGAGRHSGRWKRRDCVLRRGGQ
jgi:hypothetical protein